MNGIIKKTEIVSYHVNIGGEEYIIDGEIKDEYLKDGVDITGYTKDLLEGYKDDNGEHIAYNMFVPDKKYLKTYED